MSAAVQDLARLATAAPAVRLIRGDVVIWSGEDGYAVTAARLVAAWEDMRRVHFIDGITGSEGEAFDPGRDMLLLEATLEKLPAARLPILDPIVSAVAGDSHQEQN